jgi:hypothetical protein
MTSVLLRPLSFSHDNAGERFRRNNDVSLFECLYRSRNLVPCGDSINIDVFVSVLLALWIIFLVKNDDGDDDDSFPFRRRSGNGPKDGDGEECEMSSREPFIGRYQKDNSRNKMATIPVHTGTILRRLPHFPILYDRVRGVFHRSKMAEKNSIFRRHQFHP